jgi:quercetin dioxygenase-like cupin family protein
VELLRFGPERGRAIDAYGSRGVTLSPLTEPLARGAAVQAAYFRLAPGGRIGRHPASVPQILAVVEGSGWTSGEGGSHTLGPGDAVFWEAGEEHEMWTEEGLAAVVLEGEGVVPFRAGGCSS